MNRNISIRLENQLRKLIQSYPVLFKTLVKEVQNDYDLGEAIREITNEV